MRAFADPKVIRTYEEPVKEKAGFMVLSGNLFDSALIKIVGDQRGFPAAFSCPRRAPRIVLRRGRLCSTGRRIIGSGLKIRR